MKKTVFSTSALCFALATGCGGDLSKEGDQVLLETSEAATAMTRVLGTISPGQTRTTRYSNPPRYRAYRFRGDTGERVSVSVAANNADAVGWILDAAGNELAFNDDADESTLDSRLEATLPEGNGATYFILFREYSLRSARFEVRFDLRAAGCEYEGVEYAIGDSFPASDGCNTCACGPAGVACTKRFCPAPTCDPSAEPNRNYVGTSVDMCSRIRYACAEGWTPFSNECGCGCEH